MRSPDPRRLFLAAVLALATTGVAFSIRGDILDALRADLHLTRQQAGILLGPAFWGNTLAVIVGGALVDWLGMRRLLFVAFFGYVYAVGAIVFAPLPEAAVTPFYAGSGFLVVYSGMAALGMCQGLVEGVINPLSTALYPNDKTRRMNILHAWWPGGLIVGGCAAYAVTRALGLDAPGLAAAQATAGWKLKLGLVLVPAVAFAMLVRGQEFPETERVAAGVPAREMFREAVRPGFLLLFGCMWLAAATEVGSDQWISSLITQLTGMQGILILVYTAGIVFALRLFGSGISHRISPPAILTASAVLSFAGLLALAAVTSPLTAFVAATIFGAGKTFFWPVMLGMTAERFPKGGALLLAILGGAGNLAIAFILPVMGRWYDERGAAAAFGSMAALPAGLTVVFAAVWFWFRAKGGYRRVELEPAKEAGGTAAR